MEQELFTLLEHSAGVTQAVSRPFLFLSYRFCFAILFFVIRIVASDYPFSIIKLVLQSMMAVILKTLKILCCTRIFHVVVFCCFCSNY